MTYLGCRLFTFSVILLVLVTGCSHRRKQRATVTPAPEITAPQQEEQRPRREVTRPKRTRQKVQAPRRAPTERKTFTKQQPPPEQQSPPEQQPLTEWGEE